MSLEVICAIISVAGMLISIAALALNIIMTHR